MHDVHWSASEKRLARAVFEQALAQELAEILAEFKTRATRATNAEEMWLIRDYLEQAQREIQRKYDFRYSQLLVVFGLLLREGRIAGGQLVGLSEEKLGFIHRVASL